MKTGGHMLLSHAEAQFSLGAYPTISHKFGSAARGPHRRVGYGGGKSGGHSLGYDSSSGSRLFESIHEWFRPNWKLGGGDQCRQGQSQLGLRCVSRLPTGAETLSDEGCLEGGYQEARAPLIDSSAAPGWGPGQLRSMRFAAISLSWVWVKARNKIAFTANLGFDVRFRLFDWKRSWFGRNASAR